jgi:hypothetical protein
MLDHSRGNQGQNPTPQQGGFGREPAPPIRKPNSADGQEDRQLPPPPQGDQDKPRKPPEERKSIFLPNEGRDTNQPPSQADKKGNQRQPQVAPPADARRGNRKPFAPPGQEKKGRKKPEQQRKPFAPPEEHKAKSDSVRR